MWKKIGLIFNASSQYNWMYSHASNPVAASLGESLYRIYFSTRDKNKRSSIAYVDIDIECPTKVVSICTEPVLQPGPSGSFYEKGVSVGCTVACSNSDFRIYFVGWNIPADAPFRNQIGMATRDVSNGTFVACPSPVLDLSHSDPLTMSYPWVVEEDGLFKMWYGSHISWAHGDFEMLHVLRYAESDDGMTWRRDERELLPLRKDEGEFAMSRPCVMKDYGTYRMWFSYRSPGYAIGYAESADGKEWTRMDDKAKLRTSDSGFDCQSVEYASLFKHGDNLFILYNGNNYGESGFGIAVWE